MSFNLQKAAIFQAVKWEKNIVFRFAKSLKKSWAILFVVVFLLFLYGFLPNNFSQSANRQLLGLSLISLSLTLLCWLKESFLNSQLKTVKTDLEIDQALNQPEKYNLAEFLSFESAKAIHKAQELARKKEIARVNSSVLLYFLLEDNSDFSFVFSRALLDIKEIKQALKNQPENKLQDFDEVILESLKTAQRRGKEKVEKGDFLIALSMKNPVFKKFLIEAKLKTEDIESLVWWLESLTKKIEERKQWWQYNNLTRKGFLAKQWAQGFTITLDKFSKNWSEVLTEQRFPEIIGHKTELTQVERILSSREEGSNVLLIGEPGTGRKSIVQALAIKSALGQALPEVNHKIVKELDLTALLTQLQDKEEIEIVLDKIFKEALWAGNVILVIDEFHNFTGEQKAGMLDISGILSSYLRFPQFQLIAITNFADFHKTIEQRPGLLSLFGKVEVSQISQKEVLMLLESRALGFEFKDKIFISYLSLRNIVTYAERYFPNLASPEKELKILSESVIHALSIKNKVLLPHHIIHIISEKAQIPVGEAEEKEKTTLLNLEELIHQRIINQEEAVKEVSAALRRARSQVSIRKGPMGCFLFLGPTGVGKTETAKALTEIYFGSESRMIRLDMSEFQAIKDIPRLIGSRQEEGLLTTQVRENPFSLILFDEIEKANPKILNLLLQVLDEGFLTDGLGRKIYFQDSIIVATSNAGYKIILKAIEEKEAWSDVKQKILNYVFENGIFRPEFINRFDNVVLFSALTQENLLDISELMLGKLKKNLLQKDIEFIITQELKQKIVELGYNPVFGAREMRRVIQDKIENVLASAILSNQLKGGNKVKILPDNFELEIS